MASNGYQKMIAMPADVASNNATNDEFSLETSLPKSKSAQKRVYNFVDKLNRIMKIFLKLASIKGYDIIGRVRDLSGNYLPDSNIINLINHSMTHGKLLLGQNEFISLLREANVEPDLIVNENIRVKLLNLYSSNESSEFHAPEIQQTTTTTTTNINKDDELPPMPPLRRRPQKRTIRDVEKPEIETNNLIHNDDSYYSDDDNDEGENNQSTRRKRSKQNWEILNTSHPNLSSVQTTDWDYSPHNE